MEKKHTPTPWSAPAWAAKEGRYGIYGEKHATAGYAPLAFVQGDKRVTGGDGAANAAFIVCAVNSHEQMVAALEDAITRLTSAYLLLKCDDEFIEREVAIARAALVAAEAA